MTTISHSQKTDYRHHALKGYQKSKEYSRFNRMFGSFLHFKSWLHLISPTFHDKYCVSASFLFKGSVLLVYFISFRSMQNERFNSMLELM